MATDVVDIDLDGMVLPMANEENKFLEIDVQRKQKLISELNNQLAEYNERVDAIKEHMKNVRQELQHTQVRKTITLVRSRKLLLHKTQGLYDARKRELETEEHMKQIGTNAAPPVHVIFINFVCYSSERRGETKE